jgi:succinyl-CoA synthetase beta subunit
MHIHEYQAKQVLSEFNIPIPPFFIAASLDEVKEIVEKNRLQEAVVKAQVHAGGRGKAGGVKICKTPEEIFLAAKTLLKTSLVTNQTTKEGQRVEKVLITPLVPIKNEIYLALVIDRKLKLPVLMVSHQGGVDIEKAALSSKEAIKKVPILLNGSLRGYHLEALLKFLEWKGALREKGKALFLSLAKAFIENDASLIEINPLVVTEGGELLCLDAKMTIDDSASFRQKKLFEFYDESQLSPLEALAKKHALEYVALEGSVGCLVNGAGLAMATMDLIAYFGGAAANFLDVGGSAPKERIAEAFKILVGDKRVKVIFVNIFGGIMNCETLAEGIVSAAYELNLAIPLVVRMEGTHVEKGQEVLNRSDLKIESFSSLKDAALRVVSLAKGGV